VIELSPVYLSLEVVLLTAAAGQRVNGLKQPDEVDFEYGDSYV